MNNYVFAKNQVGGAERHIQQRLLLVITLFVIAYFIIIVRLIDVALSHQEVESSYDFNNNFPQRYMRASIVDANGTILAVNLTTASLYADPKTLIDINDALHKLKTVFKDIDTKKLKEELNTDKRFVWIRRNLTPVEQDQVNALGIPGFYFKKDETRVYPQGNLLSHILGFTNIDWQGISGVEKQFDKILNNNRPLKPESEDQLKLAIDVRVQDILYRELMKGKQLFKAIAAGGIILDAHTGKVIAMVSLPDFDPHNPGIASDDSKFNRMTLGVYEMGSTFKTINMAMAFESGKVTMKDSYDVSHPLHIAKFNIKDYHPHNGKMSVPQIFINSSNIGSALIALDVGGDYQRAFLDKLKMFKPTNIEVPEKSRTLYPRQWSKISSMTISYGHGIAVTPIHVVQAIASLINGGKWHDATLLAENANNKKTIQIVRKQTSDNIRKLMRYVVEYGTGTKANVEGYLVGGKTGSADKATHGGYGDKKAIISSFVGAFPMNDPKYVVYAMVDEPKRSKEMPFVTGGMVAAPVVARIIEQIAPILGVMPVDPDDEKIRKEFWYDNEAEKNK